MSASCSKDSSHSKYPDWLCCVFTSLFKDSYMHYNHLAEQMFQIQTISIYTALSEFAWINCDIDKTRTFAYYPPVVSTAANSSALFSSRQLIAPVNKMTLWWFSDLVTVVIQSLLFTCPNLSLMCLLLFLHLYTRHRFYASSGEENPCETSNTSQIAIFDNDLDYSPQRTA